jgi:hypothetical protein
MQEEPQESDQGRPVRRTSPVNLYSEGGVGVVSHVFSHREYIALDGAYWGWAVMYRCTITGVMRRYGFERS